MLEQKTKGINFDYVDGLRKCRTRGELRKFFELRGIEEAKEKTLYLQAATNESEAYYAGAGNMSPEDRYLDDEALFLNGTWRYFLSD